MNRPSIAALTWATIAAAVLSAALLAAGEPALPDQADASAHCTPAANASSTPSTLGTGGAMRCPSA